MSKVKIVLRHSTPIGLTAGLTHNLYTNNSNLLLSSCYGITANFSRTLSINRFLANICCSKKADRVVVLAVECIIIWPNRKNSHQERHIHMLQQTSFCALQIKLNKKRHNDTIRCDVNTRLKHEYNATYYELSIPSSTEVIKKIRASICKRCTQHE